MFCSAYAILGLLVGLVVLPVSSAATFSRPHFNIRKRCRGIISSLGDVSAAQNCPTIDINSFTVPAGKTFAISAPTGATINLLGTVTFAVSYREAPLFTLSGTSVTFQGNGHTFNGQGASYWDGKGGSGGVKKPAPMLQFTNSGTVSNFTVLNSPSRAIGLGNSQGPLVVSHVTIDDSAGYLLGHNTDCFDVSATGGTIIENCVCINQDDCLAINYGCNITFRNNTCKGGHGISVGSIDSGVSVSNVRIIGNTVTSSTNALRIKSKASATGSTVSGITYMDNTAHNISRYGMVVDQSYPATNKAPGKGVIISDVVFSGINKIKVNSQATRVLVNCAKGTCENGWNWLGLNVTGGITSVVKNAQIAGDLY